MVDGKQKAAKGKPGRIGIYAGSFDPIHNGHLAFAQAALRSGLAKVMFLVEPQPWRKQGVRALEHRIAMVQLAIADNPKLGIVITERAKVTVHETLPALRTRFKGYELVLLFGDDVVSYMAEHIAAWPHIEDLANSASLIIASRKLAQPVVAKQLAFLKREYGLPFRYDFADPDMPDVSSSGIRSAINKGQPVESLPPAVANYIREQRLYASGADS